MNFKKLSLAAALSIGIMSVGSMVQAACPVCPQTSGAQVGCPSCPQEVYSPVCPPKCEPQCPETSTMLSEPISARLSNCAPNAQIYQRQAYAFPNIGSSSLVIPKGQGLVQIGGEEEQIALNNRASGLSLAPEYGGALTLMPKNITGAASPLSPVCPTQVQQGTDILRCNIPSSTGIFQSAYLDPCRTGAASAMPTQQCGPCAAPVCDPCQGYAPANPCPTGGACPIGQATPCDSCDPCGTPQVQPCDPCGPCQTGAAAGLQGNPVSIQTSSGIQVQRSILVPVAPVVTGGACPIDNQFPDVSNNMDSGCDINTLAGDGMLAGYPDRTYKPNLPILRSEFASAMVSSLELQNVPSFEQQIFKDVALSHWANNDIDKAYNRGLIAGFSDDTFRPDENVTRAEALTAMARVIPGDMSPSEAQNVLQCYPDANELQSWAVLPVAEALNAGLIENMPNKNQIRPNDSASRAEIASMLKSLRQNLAMDPEPQVTGAASSLQPQVISSTIPTLKVEMEDIVTARTSEVGDRFVAITSEPLNLNGQYFPQGSKVRGKVVEVVRPGMGAHGSIRLSFEKIEYNKMEALLPREILSATVIKEDDPNFIGRVAAWPFTWPGKVIGIAGRTVGGTAIIASNMTEGFLTNIGNGNNELFNGKLMAAGRSYGQSVVDVGMGIYDTGKTLLSGTAGILKESGDEIAYVVKPDGSRVAQINPNEQLSIAFATYSD